MDSDSQSPYRKHLKDRKKIIAAIPDDTPTTTSTSGGLESKGGGGIGSSFSQSLDRRRRKKSIDHDNLFDTLFGSGATIVRQDSYTYSDGQFHHD
jgi:hypothetical protein